MPNQLVLPVTAGNLLPGACPATGDWQGLANLLASIFSVTFPNTFAGLTVSASVPANQSQAWLQLNASGQPVRLYYYASGAWISTHPLIPGFVMIWPYALPDFTTFDGGDSNSLTPTSGPMWQTAMDLSGNPILAAQFPLGVGTLPSGLAVSVTQTGGEQNHVLALTETPSHSHALHNDNTNTDDANTCLDNPAASGGGGGYLGIQYGGCTRTAFAGGDPANNNATDGHNTMPPYYGVYFLQRTQRLFYSVT